ncbi:MAG: hypothetical protein WC799_10040 [Desulfobacteraceae bacterium]|jgi:hypothetical protein
MGNIQVDISPPSNWQDFERLTHDYAKLRWKDDYAERNGRQGQSQAGVDVFGFNFSAQEYTGIQCKKRIIKYDALNNLPSNTLSTTEIDKEILSAMNFKPSLERFIIATTGPRDATLQEHVRTINQGTLPFKVSLMFWDDYVEFLNDNPKLMYRYYENVLKYRESYNELEHFLLLLSMAFDRPALRTPFHLESRATDFISAISATQNAISTGRLVDREGRVIDQCRVPKPKPAELKNISYFLQKTRELAADSLSKGIIIEHPTFVEIRSHEVVSELNNLRHKAVDLLNKLLINNEIEPIEFNGF